jgi:hypothetical protein
MFYVIGAVFVVILVAGFLWAALILAGAELNARR